MPVHPSENVDSEHVMHADEITPPESTPYTYIEHSEAESNMDMDELIRKIDALQEGIDETRIIARSQQYLVASSARTLTITQHTGFRGDAAAAAIESSQAKIADLLSSVERSIATPDDSAPVIDMKLLPERERAIVREDVRAQRLRLGWCE
jgi:hypothetical protein